MAPSTDSNHICRDVGIGITGVVTKAHRAKAAETELLDKKLNAALIRRAAQRPPEKVDAMADLRASSEYRPHLAAVYTRRALEAALTPDLQLRLSGLLRKAKTESVRG